MAEKNKGEKESEEGQNSRLPVPYGDESSGDVLGDIRIENEVVSTIASLAAADVEGINGLVGRFSLGEMLGRKDIDKGVAVTIEGNRVTINVEVNVEYGVNIYDACHRLQRRVKDSVEEMTGLVVDRVNVNVRGIVVAAEKPESERPQAKSA